MNFIFRNIKVVGIGSLRSLGPSPIFHSTAMATTSSFFSLSKLSQGTGYLALDAPRLRSFSLLF